MPYKTPAARYERALPLLTQARDDVRQAIAQAHPEAGCLPIPPIELPAAEAVREAAYAMCESLWTNNGSHRHPDWVTARTACTHIPEEQVLNIYELLVEWYRTLSGLHYYVDLVPRLSNWERVENRRSLDCQLHIVRRFPELVASQEAPPTGPEVRLLNRQLRDSAGRAYADPFFSVGRCNICGKDRDAPHTSESRDKHADHMSRLGWSGMCPAPQRA